MITERRPREREEVSRARLYWLLGGAAVVAVLVAIVWWPERRQYPPVSSEESLRLMRLLYSACSARDADRLAQVEAGVARADADGKVTATEKAAFGSIVAKAKSGKWDDAEKAAFKFAKDQVGKGHPASKDQ